MKTSFLKFTLALFIFCFSISSIAQDFQGKAYYMSKTTMDLDQFGGGDASPERKKQIEERMKSLLEKEYILTFNKEESIYKEEERLEASSSNGGGRGFGRFASSFSGGPKYKNVKTKELLQDQEFFGKQFLIKDDLKDLNWTMGSETKQIGNYLVFKATAVKPFTGVDISSFRGRGADAEDDKEEETNKEPKTVNVVAWYTMQIPINQGPDDFWGLPGLILEVSAGETTILCTKVVMNPKDKENLDKPEKGEVVTQQEYTEITTKKMQELRDSRGRGRGRGGRRN